MKFHILVSVVFLAALEAQARSFGNGVSYIDGWKYYLDEQLPDQTTWADYYRDHARVRLRTERRLPNGISWRLHTDTITGLSFPRITWMAGKKALNLANRLLEIAHGGALLTAATIEKAQHELDRWRGIDPTPFGKFLEQPDVALTYASDRLISVVDLEAYATEGSAPGRIIRGLTFDLEDQGIDRVSKCAGSRVEYGFGEDGSSADGNFQFQFGKLLRVCDEKSYDKFVQLLQLYAKKAARAVRNSNDPYITNCIDEYLGDEIHIGRDEPLVIFLTFDGLAVLTTEFHTNVRRGVCTAKRFALNPLIIPYAELKPFMIEGPWRDELLALPAPNH